MFARTLRGIIPALILSAIFPLVTYASSDLLFTPARGSYAVDEPIPVKIVVESTEKLSAIEASAEFDPKMLSVKIISSSQDVSWVETPSIDEEKGELRFSGIVSKDASSQLELIQLSVIGLRPGSPELRFVSGASTVAADGSGGNTLGKITHASFDILTDDGTLGENKNADGEVLGAKDEGLVVTSNDIKDPSAWYPLKNVVLNWTTPYNVKDVLVGLTKKAEDVGYKSVPDSTTTRTINDIDDGEWYFHLTPKGKGAEESAHFRIAVDNEAPTIATSTEVERLDKTDPNIVYKIEAKDKVSGVSHFEMVINGGSISRWEDDGTHEYHFRADGPGDYELTIAAFDKANNRSESHVRFNVESLPEPVVKLEKTKISEASPIKAQLQGLPGASIIVTFEGGLVHHEDTISLDGGGMGVYVLKESVLPGNYQISAVQKLQNGAASSERKTTDVEIEASIIGYMGRHLAISIAIVPVILIGIFYFLWNYILSAWYAKRKLHSKMIQKVAPLALMPPNSKNNNHSVRPMQTAPLEIKRVVRVTNPNAVIDLRKRY